MMTKFFNVNRDPVMRDAISFLPDGLYEIEGTRRIGEVYEVLTDSYVRGTIRELVRIDTGETFLPEYAEFAGFRADGAREIHVLEVIPDSVMERRPVEVK